MIPCAVVICPNRARVPADVFRSLNFISEAEHTIAEAEESIVFFDRFLVGLEQQCAADKGGDHGDQGGAWLVKIGHDPIHNFEPISRVYIMMRYGLVPIAFQR